MFILHFVYIYIYMRTKWIKTWVGDFKILDIACHQRVARATKSPGMGGWDLKISNPCFDPLCSHIYIYIQSEE